MDYGDTSGRQDLRTVPGPDPPPSPPADPTAEALGLARQRFAVLPAVPDLPNRDRRLTAIARLVTDLDVAAGMADVGDEPAVIADQVDGDEDQEPEAVQPAPKRRGKK